MLRVMQGLKCRRPSFHAFSLIWLLKLFQGFRLCGGGLDYVVGEWGR